MKAILVKKYGGIENMELADVQDPVPGLDDILVEIHAASINPIDWKTRQGKVKTILPYKPPYIPGSDVAGVVIGGKQGKFKTGDKIYARVGKMRIGTFAELIAIDESEA